MFWIYWFILVMLSGLIIRIIILEQDWKKKIAAAMILLPFILRILLVK